MPVANVTLEECDPVLRKSVDLLVSFVSTTASLNGRTEELANETGFAAWARRHALGDPDDEGPDEDTGDQPTEADAVAARELRGALIGVFRAHCDCATARVDEAELYLRRAARRYPVMTTITAGGCRFAAAQDGVLGVFGAILAAAADVTSQGLWPRLKMCKNQTCYAGFYDKTRNLSGQFCSPACNSQVSMRAYRERQSRERQSRERQKSQEAMSPAAITFGDE
ncbi:MAG TPA: CGNR zinc finger domain-containing protein [Trebonia sp.]|jgi:predicted RNA-binding Zn ribbon-like protein|nr:CGNR zinc finger domain-containing protein [Trebonia sp.]